MPIDHRRSEYRRPYRRASSEPPTAVNRLRLERGLTVEQLAACSGSSVRTIWRLMRGQPCAVRVHARVAEVLGGNLLELWPHLATDPNVLLLRPDAAQVMKRAFREG